MTALCRTGQASLTRHLHDVSGNDVPSFDSLDGFAVHAVNLPHFWFVLLQSLDGVLSIPLLQTQTGENHWQVFEPANAVKLGFQ